MQPSPYPPKSVLAHFSGALERLDGDVELLREMARFFVADAPPLIAELNAQWDRGEEWEQMSFTAHKLKGLVVTFDETRAGPLLQDLVDATRAGDEGTVRSLRDDTNAALVDLQRKVQRLADGQLSDP